MKWWLFSPAPIGGIMSPSHPRWPEFSERLEGPEGCNFTQADPKDIKSVRWRCGGGDDKTYASNILNAMGGINVPASLAYFESQGGYCDCEILFNVDKGARL